VDARAPAVRIRWVLVRHPAQEAGGADLLQHRPVDGCA